MPVRHLSLSVHPQLAPKAIWRSRTPSRYCVESRNNNSWKCLSSYRRRRWRTRSYLKDCRRRMMQLKPSIQGHTSLSQCFTKCRPTRQFRALAPSSRMVPRARGPVRRLLSTRHSYSVDCIKMARKDRSINNKYRKSGRTMSLRSVLSSRQSLARALCYLTVQKTMVLDSLCMNVCTRKRAIWAFKRYARPLTMITTSSRYIPSLHKEKLPRPKTHPWREKHRPCELSVSIQSGTIVSPSSTTSVSNMKISA